MTKGDPMKSFDDDLHRAVGMSDLASLLAAAFRFPEDDSVPKALVDGSFMADWRASWDDACGASSGTEADASFDEQGDDAFAEATFESLRREFSRMFLQPGADTPVWAYESCFLRRAAGIDGVPSLLHTRCANDVEQRMREAGVVPANALTEPVDSVHLELEFLAYLYAQWGEAMRVEAVEGGRDEAAADPIADSAAGDAEKPVPHDQWDSGEWAARIASFADEHALKWLPDFFDQVRAESRIPAYRRLAELGSRFATELAHDARAFAVVERQ